MHTTRSPATQPDQICVCAEVSIPSARATTNAWKTPCPCGDTCSSTHERKTTHSSSHTACGTCAASSSHARRAGRLSTHTPEFSGPSGTAHDSSASTKFAVDTLRWYGLAGVCACRALAHFSTDAGGGTKCRLEDSLYSSCARLFARPFGPSFSTRAAACCMISKPALCSRTEAAAASDTSGAAFGAGSSRFRDHRRSTASTAMQLTRIEMLVAPAVGIKYG